jgi:CO/xanthine dehydrogenase FAD-binding subunit
MRSYARPTTLPDLRAHLAAGPFRILAGGTDLYPGAGPQLDGDILDLTAVPNLRGIRVDGNLRIGACTTWTEVAEAYLPPALHALQQAALQVGGRQIQNAGTIGGNLCNASPAADGIPPLLACDARVELTSATAIREVPLADFLLGPRKTARAADEVLTAVIIPQAALGGRSAFVKLGARAYLVISIAMVAARLVVQDGRIADCAVAVGSCSATAERLRSAEAALIGVSVSDAVARLDPHLIASGLAPIDDIRATAAYRREAAMELVKRAVAGALT